jgi:hypothetical protein
MSKRLEKRKVITIKQAVDSFLLSCKVEGKSYGTIECYTDKLKGFLWYAANNKWPEVIDHIFRTLHFFIGYFLS